MHISQEKSDVLGLSLYGVFAIRTERYKMCVCVSVFLSVYMTVIVSQCKKRGCAYCLEDKACKGRISGSLVYFVHYYSKRSFINSF